MICIKAKSQFFGINRLVDDYYSHALSYPKDDKYRVFCQTFNFSPLPSRPFQIKIYDKSYLLIDSIKLVRGMFPYSMDPLVTDSKILWPAVYWDTLKVNPPLYQSGIMELDTLYHFKVFHPVGIPSEFTDVRGTGIAASANRYFVGKKDSASLNMTLYKLDKQFKKLDSIKVNTVINIENQVINDRVVATASNLKLPCEQGQSLQKIEIDTALNIINCSLVDSLIIISCPNMPLTQGTQTFYYSINRAKGKAIKLSPTKTLMLGDFKFTCYQINNNLFPGGILNSIIDSNNRVIKSNLYAITNPTTPMVYLPSYEYPFNNSYYAINLPYIVTVGSKRFAFAVPSRVVSLTDSVSDLDFVADPF